MDTETAMKQIAVVFPKHAVPKKDFNNKVKELETNLMQAINIEAKFHFNISIFRKMMLMETIWMKI